MGLLYQGTCFPAVELVRAEHCASVRAFNVDALGSYTLECTSTDFTQSTYDLCRRVNGGSCVTSSVSYPAFPDCDYAEAVSSTSDLFAVGLAFLVVLWAAAQVHRKFWGNHEAL